eukprot:COSAG01_NODE_19783_length_989_cov_1.821348_2_plen_184_part_00
MQFSLQPHSRRGKARGRIAVSLAGGARCRCRTGGGCKAVTREIELGSVRGCGRRAAGRRGSCAEISCDRAHMARVGIVVYVRGSIDGTVRGVHPSSTIHRVTYGAPQLLGGQGSGQVNWTQAAAVTGEQDHHCCGRRAAGRSVLCDAQRGTARQEAEGGEERTGEGAGDEGRLRVVSIETRRL